MEEKNGESGGAAAVACKWCDLSCGEYLAICLGEFTSFQLEISLFSDEGLGTRPCSFSLMDLEGFRIDFYMDSNGF